MATFNLEKEILHRPFADLASIKAWDTTDTVNGVATIILTMGIFKFNKSSVDVGDDVNIIEPTAGGGRWYRQTMPEFKIDGNGKIDISILPFSSPLQFKGSIYVAADFPTLAEVQDGWFYIIDADVTDNDPTKTNTGQSFIVGDEIAWNGVNWSEMGAIELWVDNGSETKLITARDIDLQSKKLINVLDPTNNGDAVNLSYLNNKIKNNYVWDGSVLFSTFYTANSLSTVDYIIDVHLTGTGHTFDAAGSPYSNLHNIRLIGGDTQKTVTIADTVVLNSFPILEYNISLVSDSASYISTNPANPEIIFGLNCVFNAPSGKKGILKTSVDAKELILNSADLGSFNNNAIDLSNTGDLVIILTKGNGSGASLNPTSIFGTAGSALYIYCSADYELPEASEFTNFSGTLTISYLNPDFSNLAYTDVENDFSVIQSFSAGIKTDSIASYTTNAGVLINNYIKAVNDGSNTKQKLQIKAQAYGAINKLSHLATDNVNDLMQLYSTAQRAEIWVDSLNRFSIEGNGVLRAQTANYDAIVSNDNDIPNVKWVNDNSPDASKWDEVLAVLTPKTSGASVRVLGGEFVAEDSATGDCFMRFKNTAAEYTWGIEGAAIKLIDYHITTRRPIIINQNLPDSSFVLTNAGGGKSYLGLGTAVFTVGDKIRIFSGSTDLFTMFDNGLMQTNIANYDALITANGHMINKKFFDDNTFLNRSSTTLSPKTLTDNLAFGVSTTTQAAQFHLASANPNFVQITNSATGSGPTNGLRVGVSASARGIIASEGRIDFRVGAGLPLVGSILTDGTFDWAGVANIRGILTTESSVIREGAFYTSENTVMATNDVLDTGIAPFVGEIWVFDDFSNSHAGNYIKFTTMGAAIKSESPINFTDSAGKDTASSINVFFESNTLRVKNKLASTVNVRVDCQIIKFASS